MRTTLRKENLKERNFKKHFKFHNFSEIFYCSMSSLRNANLSVARQCQYTRTILKNKNMGQRLFKHSKVDKILHCGMTRFRNIKLGVFRQYQNIKTVSLRNVGQNRFKKLSKFWSNEGKINTLLLYMTYTIKLLQEMKMLDKLILKNHFNYTILVK